MRSAGVLLGWIILASAPAGVQASGYFFPQLGGRASGLGANFVALADDPSAVFHNPAGLLEVPDKTLLVSLHLLVPDVTYTREDGPVRFPPTHLRDPLSPLPVLAFSRRDPNRRYATGAAVYPAWGAVLRYRDDGPQRYQLHRQYFYNIHATVAAAYRLSGSVSIGGQVSLIHSVLNLRRSVDARDLVGLPEFIVPGQDDPEFEAVIDLKTSGRQLGGGVGLLWQPVGRLRLGLTGTLPATVALSGRAKADISNILLLRTIIGDVFDTRVDVDLELPWVVRGGALLRLSRRVALTAELQRVGWGTVQDQVLVPERVPGVPEIRLIRNWRDAWSAGLGVEWTGTDGRQFRGGYFFDQSAVPSSTILVDGPDAAKHSLAVGASVPMRKGLSLDVSAEWWRFEAVRSSDSVYDTPDPLVIGVNSNGLYQTSLVALSAGIRWTFGR
jgi:long-chain fatty acid transport protein